MINPSIYMSTLLVPECMVFEMEGALLDPIVNETAVENVDRTVSPRRFPQPPLDNSPLVIKDEVATACHDTQRQPAAPEWNCVEWVVESSGLSFSR